MTFRAIYPKLKKWPESPLLMWVLSGRSRGTVPFLEMGKLEKLVYYANKHLGKPYKYGAKPREAPKYFDCSSFTQYLYKRIGIDLPRTALAQAHFGKKVDIKKQKLKVGDLIFFRGDYGHYNPEFPQGIGHVAIYIGQGKVIHAKSSKKGKGCVKKEKVEEVIKRKKLVVIKRIIKSKK